MPGRRKKLKAAQARAHAKKAAAQDKRRKATAAKNKAAKKKSGGKVTVKGSGSTWRGNRTATTPVKKGKKGDLEHKRIISQSKKQMKGK